LWTTYTYDVAANKIEEDDWSTGGVTTVTRFTYEAERPDVYADLTGINSIETWYVRPVGADALAARVTVPAFTSSPPPTFTTGTSGSFTFNTNLSPTPTFTLGAGSLPPGLTLSSGGVLSGTPSAGDGGPYGFAVTATNSAGQTVSQFVTIWVVRPPAITSAAGVTFKGGARDSFTFTATGFPSPTFSVTAGTLPSWLMLTSAGSLLPNGAAVPGSYTFTVTASNNIGTAASQIFTLTVASPGNQAPAFTNPNSNTWPPIGYYPFNFTATGFPTPTFSSSNLPNGFTLTPAGVLSNSPATGGVYTFTVTAANGVGPNATQTFSQTVNTPPLFTSAASTTFTVGTAGSFQLAASAAYPSAVFLADPWTPLPSWLTLSTSGLLSGTPPTGSNGTYNFEFNADNFMGQASQWFILTVNTGGHGPIGPLTPSVPNNATVDWYLTDHEGTVRALADVTGALLDRIGYDVFGTILSESNAGQRGQYGNQGGEQNQATGLTRFRYRWLMNGRWVTMDPEGLAPGPNPFEGMGNDPTNMTDPTGLATIQVPFRRLLGNPDLVIVGLPDGSTTDPRRLNGADPKKFLSKFYPPPDGDTYEYVQVNCEFDEFFKARDEAQRRQQRKEAEEAAAKASTPEAIEARRKAAEEAAQKQAAADDARRAANAKKALDQEIQQKQVPMTENGMAAGRDGSVGFVGRNKSQRVIDMERAAELSGDSPGGAPWLHYRPSDGIVDRIAYHQPSQFELGEEFKRLYQQEIGKEMPKQSTFDTTLDIIQFVLDIGSLIPVIGTPCAIGSAVISAGKGDSIGASLSLLAAIPLLGEEAGVAKNCQRGPASGGKGGRKRRGDGSARHRIARAIGDGSGGQSGCKEGAAQRGGRNRGRIYYQRGGGCGAQGHEARPRRGRCGEDPFRRRESRYGRGKRKAARESQEVLPRRRGGGQDGREHS
jgi:RHS repeat-associated protein